MAKKTFDPKTEDLNLIPIMNLVVCLIPMVLAGTALVKLGVINVNAPKFGPIVDHEIHTLVKPLNLTVAVGAEGFRITSSRDLSEILGEIPGSVTRTDTQGVLIKKKGESYDYLALYNQMVKIKTAFPEESTMNLSANADTPFSHLINVMDSLGIRLEADTYDDLIAFRSAPVLLEGGQPALLWPDVVFAVPQ